MSTIAPVLPWIVFAIATIFDVVDPGPAALIAGVVAVALCLLRRSRGTTFGEQTIDLATAVYFVVVGVLMVAAQGLEDNVMTFLGVSSEWWLALVVAIGLAIGRPFTMPIAKREAPAEVRNTEGFRRLNVRLTRAWLISFAVAGLVLLAAILILGPDTGGNATFIVIPLSIILPIRYQERVVAGARAAAGGADVVAA